MVPGQRGTPGGFGGARRRRRGSRFPLPRLRLPGCRNPLLEKSLAELSRPQTTEGKEAPSFPATRASEMTPLMTDRATFLPESSPVRHASLCRKRPRRAFFDKPRAPAAQRAAGALGTGGERKRWPHSTSMGSTSTGMRLRSSFVRRVTLTMAQRSESPS